MVLYIEAEVQHNMKNWGFFAIFVTTWVVNHNFLLDFHLGEKWKIAEQKDFLVGILFPNYRLLCEVCG